MKNLVMLCLCAVAAQAPLLSSAAEAAGEAQAAEGRLLYSQDGQRLGAVYKVNTDGSIKIIYNSKMISIPASLLSDVNGRLTAGVTKSSISGLAK